MELGLLLVSRSLNCLITHSSLVWVSMTKLKFVRCSNLDLCIWRWISASALRTSCTSRTMSQTRTIRFDISASNTLMKSGGKIWMRNSFQGAWTFDPATYLLPCAKIPSSFLSNTAEHYNVSGHYVSLLSINISLDSRYTFYSFCLGRWIGQTATILLSTFVNNGDFNVIISLINKIKHNYTEEHCQI